MYEAFYGLREKPFTLTPDPQFLYLAPPHRKALTMLEYALVSECAFCLITGEVGSGKTTLIRRLMQGIEQSVSVGLIINTMGFDRLLQWICLAFGLEHRGKDNATLYETFTRFLVAEYAQRRKVVLIVDEAQNLGRAGLEGLRVLSNINVEKQPLLQTILVGQPELRALIQSPELLQLAQRIGADHHVTALSVVDARHYVHHRLRVAGGHLNLFSRAALLLAHEGSGGIPRLINHFCDRALVYGYAERRERIDAELMRQVIHERRSCGLRPPPLLREAMPRASPRP
jgi:general secretion pathway protein A